MNGEIQIQNSKRDVIKEYEKDSTLSLDISLAEAASSKPIIKFISKLNAKRTNKRDTYKKVKSIDIRDNLISYTCFTSSVR